MREQSIFFLLNSIMRPLLLNKTILKIELSNSNLSLRQTQHSCLRKGEIFDFSNSR